MFALVLYARTDRSAKETDVRPIAVGPFVDEAKAKIWRRNHAPNDEWEVVPLRPSYNTDGLEGGIVVLSDGETFTRIDGCLLVREYADGSFRAFDLRSLLAGKLESRCEVELPEKLAFELEDRLNAQGR